MDTQLLNVADRLLHIDSDINVDVLAAYLCSALPADRMQKWHNHLRVCSRCSAAVAELREVCRTTPSQTSILDLILRAADRRFQTGVHIKEKAFRKVTLLESAEVLGEENDEYEHSIDVTRLVTPWPEWISEFSLRIVKTEDSFSLEIAISPRASAGTAAAWDGVTLTVALVTAKGRVGIPVAFANGTWTGERELHGQNRRILQDAFEIELSATPK